MNRRRLICITTLFTIALSACTTTSQNTSNEAASKAQAAAAAQQAEADRRAAREKLDRMLEIKRRKQEAEAEQQRIADEKAQAAAAEAAKPHYDPQRLAMAFHWRQWADITVPDFNIHAWLKSNWKDGRMHMRLALLAGDRAALRIFIGQWKYLRIVFADQNGVNLHQAMLATNDLHWADSLRNAGTPTVEFEGDSDVALETYETIVQWNLLWTNDAD